MKKKRLIRGVESLGLKKLLLTMKLTTLFLFLSVMAMAAGSYSQSVSLNVRNASIVQVLEEIERQTEYGFLFKTDELNLEERYSLNLNSAKIETVMSELLDEELYSYRIMDRIIVISKKGIHSVLTADQDQKTVTGKVIDSSGQPLPGVTVVVKGTTQGTVTDVDGKYTISSLPEDATLLFSFVGMRSQEVEVGSQTTIDVQMEVDAIGLEEVVAIGYGTMKKSDLTGSVSSVKSDAIVSMPTSSMAQALQGRSAGVHIQQQTGVPGGDIQIRIRGTNSIKGSNDPLWIIDGFPGSSSMVNPADIESIEVLKDASATAIYGSRGANGVIIVTTKRGKSGTTRVEYTGLYSVQSVRKKLNLMNGEEYVEFYNLQQMNDNGAEFWSEEEINSLGEDIDWQDLIFQNAPIHDHHISISGGNEKTKVYAGGGFYDQEGIITNSGYNKISLQTSIEHEISKVFSISTNVAVRRTLNDKKNSNGGNRGSSLLAGIVSAPPIVSPYEDDGSYRIIGNAYSFLASTIMNPLAYVNEYSNIAETNAYNANLALNIKPIKDLNIKISGYAYNSDGRTDAYTSTEYPSSEGSASISTTRSQHINSDNIINYNKQINNDHSLNVTAAYTYEQDVYKSFSQSGTGFISDNFETYNIGAADVIGTPSSSYSKWVLMSYLGRVNYSYKGKYMATASFRADGSSRYSEGNKWGYFPSAALAWRVSEERFMDNLTFISDLKLRASYGETGSTAISAYATLNSLSSNKTVFNEDEYTYFAPSSTYPGDLKWETTAQTDVGIDVGFLDSKFRFTADYYIKNTRDLLNSVTLPYSTGYQTTLKNIGEMQNKGFDFQLDAVLLDGQFKWNVSAMLSTNKNKVVELYDGEDITGSTFNLAVVNDYINLIREGEPLGIFYGYQEDGYTEEGQIAYKDNDESGDVSTGDKAIIGDPNPDFIYGFNSAMSYKNFELSLFIQGSQGNDIYSLSMLNQTLDYLVGLNTFKEVLYDNWTSETPNAKYPYISNSTSTEMSDRFVYDGSYVRLKNIELAYNLIGQNIGVDWLKKCQFYVSGQNLLTITGYSWYDPDVNSQGGSSSVNQGIDYYTYPTAKSLTIGVRVEF